MKSMLTMVIMMAPVLLLQSVIHFEVIGKRLTLSNIKKIIFRLVITSRYQRCFYKDKNSSMNTKPNEKKKKDTKQTKEQMIH